MKCTCEYMVVNEVKRQVLQILAEDCPIHNKWEVNPWPPEENRET